MRVYGDRHRRVAPRAALRELTATLRRMEAAPAGPVRHDLIVRAFIEAGGVAQGLADADFERAGEDAGSPAQDAAMALLVTLARKLAASAWSGHQSAGPPASAELMALALSPLPPHIEVKTPEGYAFYAVYPEAYLQTAAADPWPGPPLVIGLRSIGTGLAALVAAAIGAGDIVSLRPTGHPFKRKVSVSPGLAARLTSHEGPFAIVDEGPGLSGSSFGAAADLLEGIGVERSRIVFMPSHEDGPGPQAAPEDRARWGATARRPATFERLVDQEPLAGWFADLTGPIGMIEELSAGAWARHRTDAPGVNPVLERRKYRIRSDRGVWLAKFAGLGALGEAKLARARTLARAGVVPEPLGLRRGFLLERWEVGEPGPMLERAALIEHVGRYLGLRALAFPAEPGDGASLEELAEMARTNLAELLGEEAAQRIPSPPPDARTRPIHIDGRLHRWEWLTTPDGRLIKTDALDHSCAHDLIGCQDIAWDLAGARVELDLSEAETDRLGRVLAQACDQPIDGDLLAFFDLAYPAFQAGLWTLAGDRDQVARYAARLA